MRHRIFIAVNLPEGIKKKLLSCQEEIESLFTQSQSEFGGSDSSVVRWVKKDNLHLTLIFIGYVSDQEVETTCGAVRKITQRYSPFSLGFNIINYGPPKKMPPRMIWASGEKVKELSDLKNDLEKSLGDSGVRFEAESREFRPHVTLGRIRTWEWQKIEPEERPQVEQEIFLSFEVKSIEVMESQLKREGAEYTILETCSLRERN